MVFTRKKGRPRKHPTIAHAKEAAREKRARYEQTHVESRRRRKVEKSPPNSIKWTAPVLSPRELMDHDDSNTFAVPPNHQLAVLYRTLKNTHSVISTSLGGDVAIWFSTTLELLTAGTAGTLESLCSTLNTILHVMEPYFRAMEVTFDTYNLLSRDDDGTWEARAMALTQEVRSWRARLQGVLGAYDIGIRYMKSMLVAGEL
ncbi:hypothetical protein CYLTODRAFT_456979 [Cylindrobasidium torrendii FP15055 ss-10]|uniref:Uncharacterized protein n=1 Tax=Cylindrobasidium torrendii FP15055 ss-10 TaxID=1314674 RepID=A0A0D7B5A4_9AGAR|nr:hypothetical protein CYLTODRAFT_456979 [Cylindrobasidium torrendii FP15055 ss-10]